MNYFEFEPVIQEEIFLNLIWSSGGPFLQRSGTISAILVKGITRNNSVKYFEFGPVVQEEMSLKCISDLELMQPLC